ncbi:hypothetical protein MIR68_011757 [Amoeboaphelidium protococcarum]|nr:hypothetical protein MIR68_011757 [Amoeboaphelidium protococcarum]
MGSLWAEISSGSFNIYAQWLALLGIIFLIIAGILNVIGIFIVFAILCFVFAFIVLLLEFPLFRRCCPTNGFIDQILTKGENHWFRFGLYLVLATVLWLHTLIGSSALIIVSALDLTLVTACYLVAALRKEPHKETLLAGGQSV